MPRSSRLKLEPLSAGRTRRLRGLGLRRCEHAEPGRGIPGGGVQCAIKAGVAFGVAGDAGAFDRRADPQNVLVAVSADLMDG